MMVRLVTALAAILTASTVVACPFCGPPIRTWSQRISDTDTMVIATVTQSPTVRISDLGENVEPLKLKITHVLSGTAVKIGDEISAYHYDTVASGSHAVLFRYENGEDGWALQEFVSDRAIRYLKSQEFFGADPVAALAKYEPYLEDVDRLISEDAFHQFTNASYQDLKTLKGKLSRERIWRRILNAKTSPRNRSLYFSLLSVCGDSRETPMLETLIRRNDEEGSLGALLGCYLSIKGATALPLIEQSIFRNGSATAAEIDAAIAAIRFVGNDTKTIPLARLSESLRLLLDRPESADLIIADLARWEDWQSVDRVAALFYDQRINNNLVRTPVIRYLRACPKQEAIEHLQKLRAIDPEAVAQAEAFFPRVADESNRRDGDPGAPSFQR
ncbi:MAG: hypothetical protein NXI22_07710 [bacterium]|nr:hypothetical protein [bacterium]